MPFSIFSPAFNDQGRIPTEYTCDGEDISPPLDWRDVPPKTKSLLLICKDPDAPRRPFAHWALYNIPPDWTCLEAGYGHENASLPQALNDFGKVGYDGPCPPRGDRPHGYHFHLFALDTALRPGVAKISQAEIEKLARPHIIETAVLTAYYGR